MKDIKVNYMNRRKLEALCNFIGEYSHGLDSLCKGFNDSMDDNMREDVPCDDPNSESCNDCPFFSKELMMKWVVEDAEE